jgi:hypothetical protein
MDAQITEVRDVIIVEQLPVIAEQLRSIKAEIEEITSSALSLECTEDTVKEVKKERASLNKLYAEFEARRREVKEQILAPYNEFERVYKECVREPFSYADTKLQEKIRNVEQELKREKRDKLREYYEEYRTSIGLTERDAPFEEANINVTLTATLKSLKEKAKEHLDRVQRDLAMIATLENHAEVLAEYRYTGNVTDAIANVNARKKAIEEELNRAEFIDDITNAEAIAKVNEALEAFAPPVVIDGDEDLYEVTFTVRGTIAQLKALREFLVNEGLEYDE